jgi:hypothetical protein
VRKCGYVFHSVKLMLIKRKFSTYEKHSNNFGYKEERQ